MPQPIASTTPAASQPHAAEFYRWQAPGHPLAVEIRLDAVDRLDQEVVRAFRAVTSRGSEIGGLLLGQYREGSQPTVVITDYETVACEYKRGPLYLLAEEDQRRLEETLLRYRRNPDPQRTVVGYFRSNTRKELALDDDDVAILKRYFAEPFHVCLLIKPFASKANLAGFFLWDGAEPQRKTALTLPFNRAELAKLSAPAPAAPAQPPTTPPVSAGPAARPTIEVRIALAEPVPVEKAADASPRVREPELPAAGIEPPVVEVPEKLAPAAKDGKPAAAVPAASDGNAAALVPDVEEAPATAKPGDSAAASPAAPADLFKTVEIEAGPLVRLKRSRAKWGVLAIMLFGMAGAVLLNMSRSGAPSATPETSSLNLRVERSGGQLLLSWNRSLPLLQTAQRAILSITDGDHREDVEMDLGQLRSGSIVYSPITSDVSFRLEVTDLKNGKSVSESVRVLGGRPSPTGPPAGGSPGQSSEGEAALDPNRPPRQPPKPMAPIPGQSKESLAARLSAVEPIPAAQPASIEPAAAAGTVVAQAPEIVRPPSPASSESSAAAPASQPAAESGAAPAEPRVTQPAQTLAQSPAPVAPQTKPAATPEQPAVQPPKPAAPATTTSQPAENALRVGGQVQEARLIRRREPVYPPLARQARIQGVVKLEAVVGPDGRVERVEALSGPPLLRQAAIDAVRQWVYEPSRLNGQPVRVTTQVEINFTLGR